MNIKIGSRKSALAIKQTEAVINKLKACFPNDTFEIVGISTKGDRLLYKTLQSFGGKGVFIKEIETALLCGEIDMAVHSAKDMPTEIPEGLCISAALLRDDRSDALVYFGDTKLSDIKIIGTGSARREAQAKKIFPNAVFKPIRGNIHTRLEKVRNGEYDAVIMAKAAINRLDIADTRVETLGDDFICAAGQGILAVETADEKMKKYTDAINDTTAMTELTAERTFLEYTGGGCHAPCGASAVFDGKSITMRIFYEDTKSEVRLEMTGADPVLLGKDMARKTLELMKKGQK
ncbi:MAG: hydroxymethylbilane synthase [Hominilimicola sp.]